MSADATEPHPEPGVQVGEVSTRPADEGDRAIVSATIAMARALKLSVVAEGVETPAQRDYLLGLHCEAYQGFLCAPGLPANEFERLRDSLQDAEITP